MKQFHILCDVNEVRIRNFGSDTKNTYIPTCIHITAKFQRQFFAGVINPRWGLTNNEYSYATCTIPKDINMYFEAWKFRWAVSCIMYRKRKNLYISMYIQYSCAIPMAIPMFSRYINSMKIYFIMCYARGRQKFKLSFWMSDWACITQGEK